MTFRDDGRSARVPGLRTEFVAALRSIFVAALLGAGCGGGQTQGAAFEQKLKDDGAAMEEVRQRLASVPIPSNADVVVGVFGARSLVGAPLRGGDPWTFEHPIDCRPVIAGSVVVGAGDHEMFGLDASTGKLLWSRKAGGCLRGAADDGKTTVVSSRPITGLGGIVVAIDRDGLVVRQIEDDSNIGVPAIVDGVVFLPWEGRYVSAYDLSIGEEVARVRLTERVTRAFTAGGALFFGERTATRFDEKIALAPKGGASTVGLPARDLPGDPRWMGSGLDALPPHATPEDSVRIYARPTASTPIAIAGGRYLATHGRAAIGIDATSGAIVWIHAHAASILGGSAYEGGFAICDADGRVTFLAAPTGEPTGSVSLGKPADICLVQTDSLTRDAPRAEARPLRDQIVDVLALRYIDAAPVQRFLLRELATSKDERATETLIGIVIGRTVSEDLDPDARAALADRKLGADKMLAALAPTRDFLEGTEATTALAPLADALAKIGDARAAAPLAEHLLDPDTSLADLHHVAEALSVLATPTQAPTLRHFFAMYRSETEPAMVRVVAHVAQALARIGEGAVVAAALDDPYTSDLLKASLPK